MLSIQLTMILIYFVKQHMMNTFEAVEAIQKPVF